MHARAHVNERTSQRRSDSSLHLDAPCPLKSIAKTRQCLQTQKQQRIFFTSYECRCVDVRTAKRPVPWGPWYREPSYKRRV